VAVFPSEFSPFSPIKVSFLLYLSEVETGLPKEPSFVSYHVPLPPFFPTGDFFFRFFLRSPPLSLKVRFSLENPGRTPPPPSFLHQNYFSRLGVFLCQAAFFSSSIVPQNEAYSQRTGQISHEFSPFLRASFLLQFQSPPLCPLRLCSIGDPLPQFFSPCVASACQTMFAPQSISFFPPSRLQPEGSLFPNRTSFS